MLAHMGTPDVGLSHVALAVTDLDRSIAFYGRFAGMEVVHRREEHPGHGVAWISDLTREFVVVLLEAPEVTHPLGGWAHLGVGVGGRAEVDRRLRDAGAAGHAVSGPYDDGPPVGYWGIITDPDGHHLEIAYGQQVGPTVDSARPS